MKKGFMFSIDAIISVASLMLLVAAWAFITQVEENQNVIESLDRISQDTAITGFYTGAGSSGDLSGADFGVCNSYYVYNKGTGNLDEEKFCEKK